MLRLNRSMRALGIIRLPRCALPFALMFALACGTGGGTADAPPTARAPARSGEVWTIDRADDRASAPGAMLAFLHGLHTIVLDGNDAYAGMTKLRAARDAEGNRTIDLAGDLTATLIPEGDLLQLRFSTGEVTSLHQVVTP